MSKITCAAEPLVFFYRNNRKNQHAIRHIGKETKYINLWGYINLRNSSAEGTTIRWWEKPTDRKLLKSCSVKLLGSAERNVTGWISALIGIIPNSFGTAERIIEMTIFVSLLLFQYLKDHFRLGMPSVGGSRAALSVHKGTFHAPVVRCMWQSHVGYFILSPRAGVIFFSLH